MPKKMMNKLNKFWSSLRRREHAQPEGFVVDRMDPRDKPEDDKSSFKKWKRMLAVFTVLVMGGGAAVYFMFAATVANKQDQMGNQATGAKSKHQISFNLASGKTMGPGKSASDEPAGWLCAGALTSQAPALDIDDVLVMQLMLFLRQR